MKVVDAKFLTSSTSKENALAPDISEIVFLGRSNVGKSSLINSLTNRKNLAKSSNTPGKTRLINFFEVVYKVVEQEPSEESLKYILRFVDLPGFGYAKVSKEEQKKWERHLTDFLESRFNIRIYLHLIDSRHPNLEIDHI
ncbi:MAG: YihA family ribosome biogenesis GTP-binding protein, partial [Campylobacterales bacterium]|nr:YihA family ribosome biogenesis GTP-binding protein [Campylobacterales bacterium]